MERLFGTDGVRGRANVAPMTADVALKLGQAVAARFRQGGGGRVVIGKDTRLSGYMLESALQAGFTSAGMSVFLLGPIPTPAVSVLTRTLRADVGVMISASHNPFEDNGVKLFGPDGYKLSDAEEAEIAAAMDVPSLLAAPAGIGRARRVVGALERYVEVVKSTVPRGVQFDGLKVVVDCAHGAGYRAAPTALWELGADVVAIGDAPDGLNINAGVGSTAPEACRAAVLREQAHIGLALDGDADRLHVIDETGRLIDGDQIMALIAGRWLATDRLTGGAIAATVMSNLGLERWLAARGLGLTRTAVGDRHVVEAMRAGGLNLGGEKSGHIIQSDFATTGDGLLAGIQVLATLVSDAERASKALSLFEPLPQLVKSVRTAPDHKALQHPAVRAAIREAEAVLAGMGRLLIRPSGTEPVIRVMVEAEDAALVSQLAEALCAEISAVGDG